MPGLPLEGGQVGQLGPLEIPEPDQRIAPVVVGGGRVGSAIGGDGPGMVTGPVPGIALPDGVLEGAGRLLIVPLGEGVPARRLLGGPQGGGRRLQGGRGDEHHHEQQQPVGPYAGQQRQGQQRKQQPGAEIEGLGPGLGLAHGQGSKGGDPGLQPLQPSPCAGREIRHGGAVRCRQSLPQGAAESPPLGGGRGQRSALAGIGQQDVEPGGRRLRTEEGIQTGPESGDAHHLAFREAVGDEQQARLLARGDLRQGQCHGPLRRAALKRHDGRAQVRQQQRDGLMIPGRGHGEVGIPGKQDESEGMGRLPGRRLGQHVLKQQPHPGRPIRGQILGLHGA
ncbi:hypothetical protein D3C79_614160 [compost metagenome]